MNRYEIDKEVKSLPTNKSKSYYFLYHESGFEFGFGKGGYYKGHSHLYFYDILFSKTPISTKNHQGNKIYDTLIIIPPRTFLDDVIIDDFFFIKFCPNNSKFELPEKVDYIIKDGTILSNSHDFEIKIPWFKSYQSEESFILVTLKNNELKIKFGDLETIQII